MSTKKNIYKILLLGDEKVGKTSLYNKYVSGEFPIEYHESKIVQNHKFEINLSLEDEPINIQLYDTPGNEDKHKLYTSIYLKINCITVLFDLTNKKSFENAFNKWIPNFFNSKKVKNPQNISVVVLGNFQDKSSKIEVKEEDISKNMKEIQKYTEKYKYKEISVKDDDVALIFGLIASFIQKSEKKEIIKSDKDGIDKFLILKAKHRYNCKVLFLGDAKVGKTSIINRYINGNFSEQYKQTLSDENKNKDIFLSSEKIKEMYSDKEEEIKEMPKEFYDDSMIQMDLWDTPGQGDVHNFNRNYYKHAICCVLVFDLCDRASFEQVLFWRNNFLQYLKLISIPNEYETNYYNIIDEIPFILVGNKSDLKREITEEEIEEFMEEYKNEIKCYNEISAKDNKGIKEVFENVCKYSYIFKVKEMLDTLKIVNKEDTVNKENSKDDKEVKDEREEKEEKERLEQEEREREIKERERLLKEKEEKERLEKEEKEREIKERERLLKEKEEKERKEKEEKERPKQEEIEKQKEDELKKTEIKKENPNNISLIFELEKYFINKEGNPTQFFLEENKENIFIQTVNSLLKRYPCLNLIRIKSFENKMDNTKIDYYSNLKDNNLNDQSIIVINLE